MKKSYNILILAIFSIFVFFNLSAQSPMLEIQKFDQSVLQVPIHKLQKLTISNDAMTVHYDNQTAENITMSDISKMVFGTFSGLKNPNTKDEILVYPNPASDFIYIKNSADTHVQILNISGSTVLSLQTSGQEMPIHISHLPKGIYILKLDHKVTKFTKL